MWMPWSKRPRTLIGMYQQLTSAGCTNNFIEFKTKIEGQINELGRKQPGEFCQKCFNLRKTIINKDDEFKKCYTEKSKQLKLIEYSDEIKGFIDKCPTVRECIQKLSQPNKKPVAKKHEPEKNCVKNKDCEQKRSSTTSQKASPPTRLASKPPSTRITQEQKPQNISRQPDNREKSISGGLSLQIKQNVRDLSNSSEPGAEISKNVADHQSNVHAQVETKTQLTSPSEPDARESNTRPTDDPSQKSSAEGSESGTSDDSTLAQIFPVNGEKVDGKSILAPANSAGTENITIDGAGTHSVHVNRSASSPITTITMERNGDPLIGTHVDVEDPKLAIARSTGDNVGVSVSKDSGGEEFNYDNTRTEGDQNKAGVDGGTDNETLCIGATYYQSSNKGTRCTKGEDSELMDNNGDESNIFNKIYNVILTNKYHMINASIPIGIVLLLSLLFKYTPLWKILTKRKRNKRSHMNEKLQRVLQQPSIASEERSVPFSYSAFEYSSY